MINNYYGSSTEHNIEGIENTLPTPLFILAKNYDDSSRTSIDNQQLFKKYVGLNATDEGYVRNVYNIDDKRTIVNITEKQNDLRIEGISCLFDINLKTINSLTINQKIKFSGTVGPYDVRLSLNNCKLIQIN